MRRGWPVAVILSLALGASCAHTKSTDSGETKEGDKQASGTAKAKEPATRTNPDLHPGHPEEIPVATKLETQPLLGLHGHIHESAGIRRLGRTIAINPGSDYATGALHGALVTLKDGRVSAHQLVRG